MAWAKLGVLLSICIFTSLPLYAANAPNSAETKAQVMSPAAKTTSTPASTAAMPADNKTVADTKTQAAANDVENPELPTPVGKVVWVKGSLKATMPNKEERSLQKASIIYLHDTLTTDDNSQAQIVFTDSSLMTFRADTKFYVDKYEYHPTAKKGKSIGTYVMQLIEGGFRTITGLIAKSNPSDYKVNTPVATIGVRGTDYAVYFKKGELVMAYYAGEPCMNNATGTLCLNASMPYGEVNVEGPPVPLKEQPAVFKEKLDVVPARIVPFTGGTGRGEPPAPRAAPSAAPQQRSLNGPITSFCITQ